MAKKPPTRIRNEAIFLYFHEAELNYSWIAKKCGISRDWVRVIVRKMRKEYPHNFTKSVDKEGTK